MNLDRRLLAQARVAQFNLLAAIAYSLGASVFLIIQALLLSRVIDSIYIHQGTLDGSIFEMSAYLILSLTKAALAWLSHHQASIAAVKVKHEVRTKLAHRFLQSGFETLQTERTGELISTSTTGVEALHDYIAYYIPQLAFALLIPLAVVLAVLPYDLLTSVILIFTAPLIPLFMILIGSRAEKMTKDRWEAQSRLGAQLHDALLGLTTIRLFGQGLPFIHRIRAAADMYRRTTMQVLRVAFLSAFVLDTVTAISTAVIAVQIGLRLLGGHIEFGRAFYILLLAPEFYLPLRLLGARFHTGISGATAAKRIFEILKVTESNPYPELEITLPQLEESGNLNVPNCASFDRVTLKFPDRSKPSIDKLSVSFEKGCINTLVGATGSGKSTVFNLLLRFCDPDSGHINVDGNDISEFSLSSWRQLISWVPQSPYIFNGSIRSNLLLARPNATESELIDALTRARLAELISVLPEGLDTEVGENAIRLSAGEVQRLAIARALLKDSPILLFDESTSALDPISARAISNLFTNCMQNKLLIVIAHRRQTIMQSDLVHVLESGTLIDKGTPHELLSTSPAFCSLIGRGDR